LTLYTCIWMLYTCIWTL